MRRLLEEAFERFSSNNQVHLKEGLRTWLAGHAANFGGMTPNEVAGHVLNSVQKNSSTQMKSHPNYGKFLVDLTTHVASAKDAKEAVKRGSDKEIRKKLMDKHGLQTD